jgi:UDP-N-acetylmuramoyl-tripeptide--D-alanyl-D-alanine ligase
LEPLKLSKIAGATRGRVHGGEQRCIVRRICTDSRDVQSGDLFVCLEGPRFDGHAFAARALEQGAVAVLAHRQLPNSRPVVLVNDTRAALLALGRAARDRRPDDVGPLVVGITGTNGKTSTKELVAAALRSSLPTVASRRSFNNEIGVPLTLLEADNRTGAIAVEIGTNAPGEIGKLAAVVRPHIGIITNVGAGHLAGLGSLEGVRREKGSLLDALVGRRLAILNADDPSYDALRERAPGPVISFGTAPGAHVRATDVHCDGSGTRFVVGGQHEVSLQLLGRHAVSNALAALACACAAGVRMETAIEAVGAVASPPGRLQVRRLGDVTVIDDTYNSNPGSFAAAIQTLCELELPGRLVVVVGDMLELGSSSSELHRAAGRRLAQAQPALVVAVGEYAADLLGGLRDGGLPAAAARACKDVEEASNALGADLRGGDVVLLKGSRGVQLDQIVSRLVDATVRVA